MSNPIYGGTAGCCLYWIDKNENKDTPTVSTGATFNVDNPSFWTNLSVLSGLASGYCERLAVAKLASAGTAVTAGAKVALVAGNTWTMGPTIAADVTENDNIVSKVLNGFALGKTDAALFTTSQAVFRTVGTSLGSNYMSAVDSAIVSMCDIPGGYVRGANDTNAYTFSDLATAAKARSEIESVAGSAVAKPTANGGVLARKGALAYPVAWAKQRKWMLDTLRYTSATQTAVYATTDAFGKRIQYELYPTTGAASNTVEQCRAYEYIQALQSTAITASAFCGSSTAQLSDQEYMGRTFYSTMNAAYNTTTNSATIRGWKPGRYESNGRVAHVCFNSPKETEPVLTAQVPAAVKGATVTCNIRFEQGSIPRTRSFSYSDSVTSVTAAATVADASQSTNTKCYEVKAGGVLTVPSGQQPYSIVVSSGGMVNFASGSLASSCIVLDGGTITGLPNVQNLAVSGFYPNGPFDADTIWPFGASAQTTLAAPVNTTFENGAGSTYSTAKNNKAIHVSGGTLTVGPGAVLSNCQIVVNSGGQIVFTGTDTDHRCIMSGCCVKVLSGGTMTLSDSFQFHTDDIFIYGGGVLNGTYNWQSRNADMNGQDHLYLAPGSTASLELYGWGDDDLYKYLPCTTHLHFRQNSIENSASESYQIPNLSIVRKTGPAGPIVTASCESMFYNTRLYIFNGNGIVLNVGGNTTSVSEGLNTMTVTVPADATTLSIAGYTESYATIDSTNRPLDVVTGGARTRIYLGYIGTDVIYRCAIQTLSFERDAVVANANHYEDFRVRQWSTDPATT